MKLTYIFKLKRIMQKPTTRTGYVNFNLHHMSHGYRQMPKRLRRKRQKKNSDNQRVKRKMKESDIVKNIDYSHRMQIQTDTWKWTYF